MSPEKIASQIIYNHSGKSGRELHAAITAAIHDAVTGQSQEVADLKALVASKEQSLQLYKNQTQRLIACMSAMPDTQKAVAEEREACALIARSNNAYETESDIQNVGQSAYDPRTRSETPSAAKEQAEGE